MTLLSTLKRLFRVIPSGPSQENNSLNTLIYIHEDDAGQIELLPSENLIALQQECEKINAFSGKHFMGNGWSDIYIRPESPTTMLDKGILIHDFKRMFFEKGFVEKELRFSGMKSVPIGELALTYGDLRIYCSFKKQLLESIYFDYYVKEDNLELFNSIVFDLSNKYGLVLANWNKLDIFDTRLLTEIERYHASE